MSETRTKVGQVHPADVDVVIVGAGFAGLYMLYKCRQLGLKAVVLESADGIGGTWYHNRYPGARCDIESLDYSYSFSEELQQEWHWTERYASQPEILSYIEHVADRFDLNRDIRLNTRVIGAEFDENTARWAIITENGDTLATRYFVMATGVLSAAQVPDIPGRDSFEGEWYHTGSWPHEEVDFTGKRVAVVGTGSSGTQLIPIVAESASELYVLQRTANFCMPAQNRPLDPELERDWKAHYPERRAFARSSNFGHNQLSNPLSGKEASAKERRAEFERRWELGGLYMMRAFKDIMTDADVNLDAVSYVHEQIDALVNDPATSDVLKPKDLFIGTKRLSSGTNYYETFNRGNVSLIDVAADPIKRIQGHSIELDSGRRMEVDVIIYATGFDAMSGSMLRIDPVGRKALTLSEHWSGGPRTYLGITVAGFPNMFIIAGPGSPSVFSNMVNSIEQHVEWVAAAMSYLDDHGFATLKATSEAERDWVQHVNDIAERTLYRHARKTWFYGANTPGKPVVFMPYLGGVNNYVTHIASIAENGYTGFELTPQAHPEKTERTSFSPQRTGKT